MKKLFILSVIFLFITSGTSYGASALTTNSPTQTRTVLYNPAGSGDISITFADCERTRVTDQSLTGNADLVLDSVDDDTDFHIKIVDGTYTISLVPPTGEALWMGDTGAFLDANDEIDLSNTEGDLFVIQRSYSKTKTDYAWFVYTVYGTQSDGGAAD